MRTACRMVQSLAPSRELGNLSKMLSTHVGACLSCQAEMARYGKLRRELSSLGDVVVEAPRPLAAEVAAAIASGEVADESATGLAHPARVVAAAGAVVAATAGAAAVAVWRHSKPVVR